MQIVTLADMKQMIGVLPAVRPDVLRRRAAGLVQAQGRHRGAARRREVAGEEAGSRAWAFDVGRQRARLLSDRQPGPPRAAPRSTRWPTSSCFRTIRARLGLDRVRFAATGAAAIDPEALEFVLALGLPCCEMWGMSELTCAATVNPPDAIRIGTVGKALAGAELRIAEDGELLVRGPLVMKGYRNEPEKTAETIDADGWLHTGDIATIDDDGYVRIVDRKKELMINAAGKNMSPANIEGTVKVSCPLVGSAVAIGDDRPYVVALLTLDPDAAAAFAAAHGLADASPAALAADPAVRAAIEAGIKEANARLARVEQIKKFDDPARRVGARRRRDHADDEAQAQADREQVRRRRSRSSTPAPEGCAGPVASAGAVGKTGHVSDSDAGRTSRAAAAEGPDRHRSRRPDEPAACRRLAHPAAQRGHDRPGARRARRRVRRHRHQPAVRAADGVRARRRHAIKPTPGRRLRRHLAGVLVDHRSSCRSSTSRSSCAPTTTARAASWRWPRWPAGSPTTAGGSSASSLMLGVVGASLFYGDSVITPAISVLSAVEGLEVASPGLATTPCCPIGIAILAVLFVVQRFGTHVVGRFFGPVMVLWFLVLAVTGLPQVVAAPGRSSGPCSPTYIGTFVADHPFLAFIALGAVVLSITGAEALYADMGHFGRAPIRRAWFFLVFPCLTLNYLGQGALVLQRQAARSATRSSCSRRAGRASRWSSWPRWPPSSPRRP